MAKGKRGPTRRDKREEYDAYEKRKEDEEREEGGEEEEAEEEEAEEGEADSEAEIDLDAEADAEVDADADADAGDDDDEDRPKKKAKVKKVPKKPAAKKAPSKRSRAAKEVRTRAVWVVYDNGNKVVEKFPYSQKKDAEDLLAKKMEEKKGTFYINMVKEEIKE